MTLLVAFACNNPDNGSHGEKFEACNVCLPGESSIELTRYGHPMTIRFFDRWIRVGRRNYSSTGSIEWFGNWCWDAARVSTEGAAQIIAPTEIYEACKAGQWITAAMLVQGAKG